MNWEDKMKRGRWSKEMSPKELMKEMNRQHKLSFGKSGKLPKQFGINKFTKKYPEWMDWD